MSDASKFIEDAEALADCRWDDESNPNALYALLGAMAREMGRNPHGPKDDIAAGMLLAHQMTPEAQRKRQTDAMIAALLMGGMGPDDVAALMGGGKR